METPTKERNEMNTTTSVVLITLSSLSLIASTTTLAIVLVGSRKMKSEMEEVKTKTNNTVNNIKFALDNLEL
jgi:hypothetical protein